MCALGLVMMSGSDVWELELKSELEAGGFRCRVSWWLDGPLLAARFFLVFLVSFSYIQATDVSNMRELAFPRSGA